MSSTGEPALCRGQSQLCDTGEAKRDAQIEQSRHSAVAGLPLLPPAIRFDPQRRAHSPELRAIVADLTASLLAHEARLTPRQRRRKAYAEQGFVAAVDALVCNLAGLVLDPLSRPLAVPKSSARMSAAGPRYANPVFGKHFLRVLAMLEHPEVDLVRTERRGFRYAGGASRMTEIAPTTAFARAVPLGLISWEAFRRLPEPEVIVLKAPRQAGAEWSEEIDYPETRRTRQLRREVQGINGWLADAPIFLAPGSRGHALDTWGQPIDPGRRVVRRVFNEGRLDFSAGGRLYDAFWLTMPKAERFAQLRLGSATCPGGEPIAAVDMRSFNPRAAYAIADQPIPGAADPYDIDGDGSNRDAWKQLVNAMLSATKPLTRLPDSVRLAFPPGTKARDVITRVEQRHPTIAHLFGRGVGFRLALIESSILIDALGRLRAVGIVGLPIHDGILCPASEAERVADIMEAASEAAGERFGCRPAIDYGPTISMS